MSITTDPKDPRLGHGPDTKPVKMNEAYLVLSEEERSKGYTRPYRDSYVHTGIAGPEYPLQDITPEQKEMWKDDPDAFVKYEPYPPGSKGSAVGRFWTQKQIDSIGKGCGTSTKMHHAIAETYARNPHFYGNTYCIHCSMHLPLKEFRWSDGTVVGS